MTFVQPLFHAFLACHSQLKLNTTSLESYAARDMRPHMLLGHIHYRAGRYDDAAAAYQSALSIAPRSCPLELYLRLGAAFLQQGKP
eukprot:scaffold345681_cov34-Prasinocladus_malaysianus.AAC.1